MKLLVCAVLLTGMLDLQCAAQFVSITPSGVIQVEQYGQVRVMFRINLALSCCLAHHHPVISVAIAAYDLNYGFGRGGNWDDDGGVGA